MADAGMAPGAGAQGSAGAADGGQSGGSAGGNGGAGDAPRDGLLGMLGQQPAGNNAGGNPAGNPAGGEGPTGYWPEGVPETLAGFRGKTDKETIDALTAHATQASERGQVPKDAKDYQFQASEDFTKRYGDLAKDKVLPLWRDVAHKNGLTDKQFSGAIQGLFEQMAEKGLLPQPPDLQAELRKLEPKFGDPSRRARDAQQRIQGVVDNITGLVTRDVLTKVEGNVLMRALASTGDGVIMLEKLFGAMGKEHGLQGGGSSGAAPSMDDVRAKMKDPRYDSGSLKYDPKYRRQVDDEYRQAHSARA